MGVYNATVITNAGQNLIASAIAGGQAINFTAVKTSTHVYPAGTALQNLTSLSDVKQTVAPTSVDVYNNNVVQISARVPNTGIATAYLINTIGLFGSAGGAETLIAVLTAQTPDEVPVFDAEAPAAFIFNIQMTIQNADEVVFEVNDTGTATVADLNRVAQPFSGATASAAGSGGRVPAPAAGDDGKFLRGDATWTAPADMVEAFTSSDVADGGATAWTGVNPLTSGETNKSIFAKLSQMFKNIRYLYKMLGTTDISSIGNGTVTGGLSSLSDSLAKVIGDTYIVVGRSGWKISSVDATTGTTGNIVIPPPYGDANHYNIMLAYANGVIVWPFVTVAKANYIKVIDQATLKPVANTAVSVYLLVREIIV